MTPAPSFTTARRVALLALSGTLLSLGSLPGVADARPSIRIARPVSDVVAGKVPFMAVTRRASARRVAFYIDGRRAYVDRRAPWRFRGRRGHLDTGTLAPGRHRLTARAVYRNGARAAASKSVRVRRPVKHITATATQSSETWSTAPVQPPPPVAPTGTPWFAADFETGTLGTWTQIQRYSPERLKVVSSPVRAGRYAAQFEVRPGELWNDSARSELSQSDKLAGEGDERTYSWSTMFAENFPNADTWQDFFQWKHNSNTGTPPMQMKVQGNTLGLHGGPQVGYEWPWKTPLVRGRWLDFKVRIKFSSDPKQGWVEIYYQGAKVLDRYPMATLYPNLQSTIKMGLYRDKAVDQTGMLWHDELLVTAP